MIDSDLQKKVLFIGDSPNDSMMFGYFDQSVGVANVMDFMDEIDELPKYITSTSFWGGVCRTCKLFIKINSLVFTQNLCLNQYQKKLKEFMMFL